LILVDANIFMYAVGAEHPHKLPSLRFLEKVARDEIEAAVDAEVLQEILHRYRALQRWPEGGRAYDLARRVVPVVIPITTEIMDRARVLLDRYQGLSARDALHASVVQHHDLKAICSYDGDFDEIEGVERMEPDL
jgi:predicted nucleic acid-binding protein